jgi:hypothetical protein
MDVNNILHNTSRSTRLAHRPPILPALTSLEFQDNLHLALHALIILSRKIAMPPRKSDVSKAATGDEAAPSKDQVGINIEVQIN